MIRSMTGFGRGQVETKDFTVRVEVRSVNNRGLRVSYRLPERLQALEPELEKVVRAAVSRGTINVVASFDEIEGEATYEVNAAAIKSYRESLEALRRELGVSGETPLSALVTLPGAMQRARGAEEPLPEQAGAVFGALEAALAELVAARKAEGAQIWNDLTGCCATIEKTLVRVEERRPVMIEEYRERLRERLAKLLEGIGSTITEEDVRREIVVFADRADISEELSRLKGHIEMLRALESREDACGRRLEFIAQEMFREANTMASKANDARMVEAVLDVKAEIEKMREQALNVE